MRALKEHPIDFFGAGWESIASDFRDRRFLGTVAHHDIGLLCQRYAVLLNFDPNWGHGLHDRVFTAVGNGCRVLTNRSGALDELRLPAAEAVLAYDANNPVLGHLAERALSLPPMATEALLGFRTDNSWFSRMDRFLTSEFK